MSPGVRSRQPPTRRGSDGKPRCSPAWRCARRWVFKCVGVPGIIQQILAGAAAGSRVVIAGLCMQEDRFEPTFGILKEIDLIFSQYYMSSQGLQVSQIASGLGYSEQSSYTRACRRWFGESRASLWPASAPKTRLW